MRKKSFVRYLNIANIYNPEGTQETHNILHSRWPIF